jgi:hypothetical protein
VKVLSADGSVGSPHVRVGHRQALKYTNPKQNLCLGFCAFGRIENLGYTFCKRRPPVFE